MADTYLPADVRKRIVDVMRERKMTQRELALRIDVNESTISRFLSGKTEKKALSASPECSMCPRTLSWVRP